MTENLGLRQKVALRAQRAAGHAAGVLLLWPATVAWMRGPRGYRIRRIAEVRRRARQLLAEAPGPVIVCPNHLTWIDSVLVQWALFSPSRVLRSYETFAWNLPEQTNFYSNFWLRIYCYFGKCIPITRGGDRKEQKLAMSKIAYLLRKGDLVMVFPEGGRSQTGRVERESVAYGVGRMVKAVDDCRVLCVYLRGDRQDRPSILPDENQTFSVDMELFQPRAESGGLRATREISTQIVEKLAELEGRHFAVAR
jgi:hypothetical protein